MSSASPRYAVTRQARGGERAGDRRKARIFQGLMFFSLAIGILTLAVLLIQVVMEGWPRLNMDLLTNFPSRRPARSGAQSAIFGTIWLMAIVMATAVPLGFGAAIYLEEYAPDNWLTRIIEINISNLAGVPSIIYGLLGLALFVNYLGPITGGKSVLSGALTLTLLILPVIIIATREALRAIPDTVREGGFALGATRWEVVRSHLLPMALPGALTGTILALSRAIGEAAPLIVVGAATYITFAPDSPFSEYSALPIQIFSWISQPQEGFQIDAAAGIVVLMAVLILANSFAIWLRNRYQRRT